MTTSATTSRRPSPKAPAPPRTPYFGFGGGEMGSGVPRDAELLGRLRRLSRRYQQIRIKEINDTLATPEDQDAARRIILQYIEKHNVCPWPWGMTAEEILSSWTLGKNKELLLRSWVDFAAPLFIWAKPIEKIDDVCVLFALRQAHAEQMIPVCRGVAEPSPVTVWWNGEGYTYKSAEELCPDRQPEQDPDERYVSSY